MTLKLERRDQQDRTPQIGNVMLTPMMDENYWSYRVRLTEAQSVVGFPKFGTVGIGFAVEDDWNTNLPYTCQTIDIVSHIWHNAFTGVEMDGDGDPVDDITIAQVYAAVELIQIVAEADRPDKPGKNTQPSMVGQTWRQVTA